jgi:hypothetical protein
MFVFVRRPGQGKCALCLVPRRRRMDMIVRMLPPVAVLVEMAVPTGRGRMRMIMAVRMPVALAAVVAVAGRVSPEFPK